MVLVDTSVWIETVRRRQPLDLLSHVSKNEVVTCLPVVQELLAGMRDPSAFRLTRTAMLSFPMVDSPLPEARSLEAVDIYRTARQAGLTVRSHTDCLIAAIASAHDLELLHRDRDFAALARVVPLRQRTI